MTGHKKLSRRLYESMIELEDVVNDVVELVERIRHEPEKSNEKSRSAIRHWYAEVYNSGLIIEDLAKSALGLYNELDEDLDTKGSTNGKQEEDAS